MAKTSQPKTTIHTNLLDRRVMVTVGETREQAERAKAAGGYAERGAWAHLAKIGRVVAVYQTGGSLMAMVAMSNNGMGNSQQLVEFYVEHLVVIDAE
jgi:hypothetical protein